MPFRNELASSELREVTPTVMRIRTRFFVVGLLLAIVAVLSQRPAYATPEDEARALNAQGRKFLDAGNFVGALDLFRAAYARYPNVKLLLNIGTALRNLGRYAEAADAYERYVNDSAADPKHRAECLKILEELRHHIGWLHVEVNEPGARVIVDGKPLGGSPQSVTIRVEEGSHTVVAEKQGYAVAAATVPIKAGDERTVELRLTRPGPDEPPPASPPSSVEPSRDEDEQQGIRRHTPRWALPSADTPASPAPSTPPVTTPRSTKERTVQVFVKPSVGTGFAVLPGGAHTEVAWQFQTTGPNANRFIQQPVGTTGIALLPLFADLEIGLRIKSHFVVSLILQTLPVTGANAETVPGPDVQAATTKAKAAVAVFARFGYLFLRGRVHPFLHAEIGGGEIRAPLDISSAESDAHPLVDKFTADTYNANPDPNQLQMYQQQVCANHQNCTDTVSLGYFLFAGGLGAWFDLGAPGTLGSHFGLVIDHQLFGAIGTSDRQSGFAMNMTLGLVASY